MAFQSPMEAAQRNLCSAERVGQVPCQQTPIEEEEVVDCIFDTEGGEALEGTCWRFPLQSFEVADQQVEVIDFDCGEGEQIEGDGELGLPEEHGDEHGQAGCCSFAIAGFIHYTVADDGNPAYLENGLSFDQSQDELQFSAATSAEANRQRVTWADMCGDDDDSDDLDTRSERHHDGGDGGPVADSYDDDVGPLEAERDEAEAQGELYETGASSGWWVGRPNDADDDSSDLDHETMSAEQLATWTELEQLKMSQEDLLAKHVETRARHSRLKAKAALKPAAARAKALSSCVRSVHWCDDDMTKEGAEDDVGPTLVRRRSPRKKKPPKS